jgi:thiamine-phosphate pyrophosphorylase
MGLSRLPAPFLLITDRKQARRPLVEVIEAALEGGCRWVSLREKDLASDARLALVHDVSTIVQRFGGTLLVHADVEAAQHADGVHLPSGANVGKVRARLGNKSIIGLSCHTPEEVANAEMADYVTLGPFAPTESKPGYLPTLKLEVLAEAARFGIPVLALGGVDETNVGALRRAGAAGFAVMGTVMRSDDPGELVTRMVARWDGDT